MIFIWDRVAVHHCRDQIKAELWRCWGSGTGARRTCLCSHGPDSSQGTGIGEKVMLRTSILGRHACRVSRMRPLELMKFISACWSSAWEEKSKYAPGQMGSSALVYRRRTEDMVRANQHVFGDRDSWKGQRRAVSLPVRISEASWQMILHGS